MSCAPTSGDPAGAAKGPSRRRMIGFGAALAAAPWGAAMARPTEGPIRAVCFDAFVILDPRPVLRAADALSPGLGADWFQTIFAYTWLRTTARQYADFAAVAEAALATAASARGLAQGSAELSALAAGLSGLELWPDVRDGLARLRQAGLRLALLSNFSPAMLSANLRRNAAEALFDHAISTDEAQAFKPAPAAYGLAMRRLHLAKAEILFAPFAAWDAAGAAWFGYPTAWVNRAGQRPIPGAPEVPAQPDLRIVISRAGAA